MGLKRKDLLTLEELSAAEITSILDQAAAFKVVGQRPIKKVPALRGKTVVNLFFEPSTRTRTSFELAAKRLSADVVNFTASASSFPIIYISNVPFFLIINPRDHLLSPSAMVLVVYMY